jgi:hypothetical protein
MSFDDLIRTTIMKFFYAINKYLMCNGERSITFVLAVSV